MLVVSVARQLWSGNSFARLLCCPLKPSGAGRRRSASAKLTMPIAPMTRRSRNTRRSYEIWVVFEHQRAI
jgi:hypothetical protein